MHKHHILTLYAFISPQAYLYLCKLILPLLPEAESLKVLNTKRREAALLSLAGKFLLKEGMHRLDIDPSKLKLLQYNEHKRPFIDATFDFNISHSGRLVACALSKHTKIGLDVEQIKPFRDAHLHTFFDQKEKDKILTAKHPIQTFYDLWTRKEAVLKADGRGLSLARKKLRFEGDLAIIDNQQVWELHSLPIDQCYAANVAVSPAKHLKFILEELMIP